MESHRSWFVSANVAMRQKPVPELGVARAPGSTNVESLVEITDDVEYFSPESHTGSRSYLPGGTPRQAVCGKELLAEVDSSVPPAKTPMVLKKDLSVGIQFTRQDQSRHASHMGTVEGRNQALKPSGVKHDVVVRVGDYATGRCPRAGVPRDIEPEAIFPTVLAPCCESNRARMVAGRSIVDDDDLPRYQRLIEKRFQAPRQRFGPIARTDYNADIAVTPRFNIPRCSRFGVRECIRRHCAFGEVPRS